MHHEAILAKDHPLLGPKGTLITIKDVEKHFSTSHAANADISCLCVNDACQVPVLAVITGQSKIGRKSSPSSYFRADKKKRHINGCRPSRPKDGEPTIGQSATSALPANPNRTEAPAVWLDPLQHIDQIRAATSVGTIGDGNDDAYHIRSGARRSSHGEGTSHGQSMMVSSFAKDWRKNSKQNQKSMPLRADWNPGGNYESAFHSIGHWRNNATLPELGQKIFVGVLQAIALDGASFSLALSDHMHAGASVEIYVPSHVLSMGKAGIALHRTLSALSERTQVGGTIFALGIFQQYGDNVVRLPIPHPHYLYVEQ